MSDSSGLTCSSCFLFVCFVFLSYKYFPWCHADLLNSFHLSSFILGRQSSQASPCSLFLLLTKCYCVNRSVLSTTMPCNSVSFSKICLLSIFCSRISKVPQVNTWTKCQAFFQLSRKNQGRFQGHYKDFYLIIFHIPYYVIAEFSIFQGDTNLGIPVLKHFPHILFLSVSLIVMYMLQQASFSKRWWMSIGAIFLTVEEFSGTPLLSYTVL